ncbi:hypothetical protein [Leisingera sp. ANG-M7]|uniref:hypothetical protein n=1 Tax=Leisingera sp. ANG-M7 TaxID=1577902 RepID=UPI00057C52DC|nr:hypothetical protein [Leisingera sp. ANG-M7]KIC39446.1 hypothetical protein RA26_02035 [Leisingera sp. ANG-M7]
MKPSLAFGDLIGALLTPIFEAIFAFLQGVLAFFIELLAPFLFPVFEFIGAVISGLFLMVTSLVWGVIEALGMAQQARGLSLAAYALSAAGFVYLLYGFMFGGLSSQEMYYPGWAVLSALSIAVFGLLLGWVLFDPPEDRRGHRKEEGKQEAEQGKDASNSGRRLRLRHALVFFAAGCLTAWGLVWYTTPRATSLPPCTTSGKLRNFAADALGKHGKELTADMVGNRNCTD